MEKKSSSAVDSFSFRKISYRQYSVDTFQNGIIETVFSYKDVKQYNPVPDTAVTVFDVASYILQKIGVCTTMKLHKLLYYCQAWSLVWDEAPLFNEHIEAWANGPVVRKLFEFHRGLYEIQQSDISIGNVANLSDTQRETIESVLKFYGDKSAQWLINLTHSEKPWIDARKGLDPNDRGCVTIKNEAMADYYSGL